MQPRLFAVIPRSFGTKTILENISGLLDDEFQYWVWSCQMVVCYREI